MLCTLIGLFFYEIHKHSCWSQHISVLTTCTLMFGQVCIIEPSFFNVTSGMHRRPIEGQHLVTQFSIYLCTGGFVINGFCMSYFVSNSLAKILHQSSPNCTPIFICAEDRSNYIFEFLSRVTWDSQLEVKDQNCSRPKFLTQNPAWPKLLFECPLVLQFLLNFGIITPNCTI